MYSTYLIANLSGSSCFIFRFCFVFVQIFRKTLKPSMTYCYLFLNLLFVFCRSIKIFKGIICLITFIKQSFIIEKMFRSFFKTIYNLENIFRIFVDCTSKLCIFFKISPSSNCLKSLSMENVSFNCSNSLPLFSFKTFSASLKFRDLFFSWLNLGPVVCSLQDPFIKTHFSLYYCNLFL